MKRHFLFLALFTVVCEVRADNIQAFLEEDFDLGFVNVEKMPLVIAPKNPEMVLTDFNEWAEQHQEAFKQLTAEHGALLLRGFPAEGADAFASVIQTVIGTPSDYRGGEGSRTKITSGVYTSTEAPMNFHIPLHHELSCTDNPCAYICFYCDIAPPPGTGQTLLGSTERITQQILLKPDVWNLFNGKTLKYISRHPPEGSLFHRINPTHKTWQISFETEDKHQVENICREKGFAFEWLGDWIEVTRRAPAIRDPDDYFDTPYWYNQSHLYHTNPRLVGGWLNYILASTLYLNPTTRPYDIKFEDDSEIPREIMYQIYDVLEQETIRFDWHKNDILIIDNRRALHGKAPCDGPRRILTSMVY